MGLYVTVCKGATKAPDDVQARIARSSEPTDEAYDLGLARPYVEEGRENRAVGVESGTAYAVDQTWSFGAGYNAYNNWRKDLAALTGIDNLAPFWARSMDVEEAGGRLDHPFVELLHFSDSEGTIGPEASRRLAADFAEWDDRARDHGGWFYEAYQNWRHAFQDAAQDGFVMFR